MLINNIRKSPTFPIRNTIHAPTRGATLIHFYMHYRIFISIHAPTRGATVIILKDLVMYQFQSTLLQEERHSQMYFLYSGMNFNPRSYKRSDYQLSISHAYAFDFNPRSYKRSDSKNAQYSLCISAIIIA